MFQLFSAGAAGRRDPNPAERLAALVLFRLLNGIGRVLQRHFERKLVFTALGAIELMRNRRRQFFFSAAVYQANFAAAAGAAR